MKRSRFSDYCPITDISPLLSVALGDGKLFLHRMRRPIVRKKRSQTKPIQKYPENLAVRYKYICCLIC